MSATAFEEKVSTQLHFKNDKRWGVMRKLLNTLYVTTPERYLALDGENVLVLEEKKVLIRLPLHNLEGIVTFGYTCLLYTSKKVPLRYFNHFTRKNR